MRHREITPNAIYELAKRIKLIERAVVKLQNQKSPTMPMYDLPGYPLAPIVGQVAFKDGIPWHFMYTPEDPTPKWYPLVKVAATLLGDWVASDPPFQVVKLWRDFQGDVRVDGSLKDGSIPSYAFQIPATLGWPEESLVWHLPGGDPPGSDLLTAVVHGLNDVDPGMVEITGIR